MHFAIDIDQTICGSNAGEVYAAFHNKDLKLHIASSKLNKISYFHFLLLPEVEAFRKENEREFQASRHRAIATPDVLSAFEPIPGAIQALTQLSQLGDVCYYTARIPKVRTATQNWLEHYTFPSSKNVICCSSIPQKVMALAEHSPLREPITLIDDRGHTHFLEIVEKLQQDVSVHNLLERLTILAFGASRSLLPEKPICRLFELPAWSELEIALARIKKEL